MKLYSECWASALPCGSEKRRILRKKEPLRKSEPVAEKGSGSPKIGAAQTTVPSAKYRKQKSMKNTCKALTFNFSPETPQTTKLGRLKLALNQITRCLPTVFFV